MMKKAEQNKVTFVEYFFSEKKSVEFSVWVAGFLLGVFAFITLLVIYFKPSVLELLTYDCYVRAKSGIICPGCGGTRAFFSFIRGQFLMALCYHAVVPYMGIIYIVFMVRGLLHFLTKGKLAFMKFRLLYIYVGIGIIIVQFLVKNICLFLFHITWI